MAKENLLQRDYYFFSDKDYMNTSIFDCEKSKDYSFMVPNEGAIDYSRIDRERYEDAVAGGYYASDAFIVTGKELDCALLAISNKFLSRFSIDDEIRLCNMPFYYHRPSMLGWGNDYGIKHAHYRYYFISHEQIPEVKAQLADIRKIHVPHFKVNVSSI